VKGVGWGSVASGHESQEDRGFHGIELKIATIK